MLLRRISLAPTCLLLLATCSSPPGARAATLNWANPSGGSASLASNWSPVKVPAAADVLRFPLPGLFGITFDAAADSSLGMQFTRGNVGLSVSPRHDVTGSFSLLSGPGDSAAVDLSAGSLRIAQGASVGGSGSTRLTVRNETSRLRAQDFGISFSGGTTRIRVLDGGWLEVLGALDLGGGPCSTLVSGTGSATGRPARLTAPGDVFLGSSRLEVADSGRVEVGGSLTREPAPFGAFFSVDVNGGGELFVGDDWDLDGDLGGDVRGRIADGGLVRVADTTRVRADYITHGRLELAPGGTLDTGSLRVDAGADFLQSPGSKVIVRGGVFALGGQPWLAPQQGDLELRDGTAVTLTPDPNTVFAPALSMRHGGLRVATGASVDVQGHVQLRDVGSGAVDVDSGGVFTSGNMLAAAANHAVRVTVRGGSQLAAGTMDLDSYPFSTGGPVDVEVSGAGSVLAPDIFDIGATFDGGAGGSPARAVVESGGHIVPQGINRQVRVGLMGSLKIGTGSVVGPSQFSSLRGRLALDGGVFSTTEFSVTGSDTATIRGFGTLAGRVRIRSTAARIEPAGGTLHVGASGDTGGVFHRGILDVGAGVVNLLDADHAFARRVLLGGGFVTAANGLRLVSGDSLSGNGTVNGPVLNDGAVVASGVTGLTFGGLLTGAGTRGGTRFLFESGGGFTGAGVLDADVVSQPGSVLTATGNLTLGRSTSTNGVNLGGTLLAGSHVISLRDANLADLGALTRLAGGVISCLNGLQVRAGRRLEGNGRLDMGGTLTVAGTIAPGDSLGRLHVRNGALAVNGGTIEVQLGAHAAGRWDTLVVDGALTLTNARLQVRLAPDFTWGTDDTFTVVTCASLGGSFTTLDLPPVPPNWTLQVRAEKGVVQVIVRLDPALVAVGDAGAPRRLALATTAPGTREARLSLALPAAADVVLDLFDVSGRRVATLARGPYTAGVHRWDLAGLPAPSGVYFARAEVLTGGRREVLRARVPRPR